MVATRIRAAEEMIEMRDRFTRNWMINDVMRTWINKVLLMVILAVHLVACGGGGGGSGGDVGSSGTAEIARAVIIRGSVGDGPVTGATITVYAENGDELGTMTSDNTASFRSSIKAKGRDYPLLIKATGGFDLVTGTKPAFEMLSVMLRPSDKQQNINPFTTLIVKTAQYLPGGLNANNVIKATATVMNKLGFGLDPNLVPDPITTTIDTSNAANIIKASEVLAEMIRRTSNTLSAAGTQVTCDGVMTALAADLTDGFLDGRGARAANARVAAVAAVVSSQVLVEALRNVLKVDGLVAAGMLDDAIRITQQGISSSQLTARVRITAGMLDQTQIALAAAEVLDSSSQVVKILMSVGAIAPNSLPVDIAGVLSTDASTYLDNAVVLSARATTEQIASIGNVVRGTESTVSDITASTDTGQTGTVSPGSLALSWMAPVARADGTPLSLADIDGYRIHYGQSTGNYTSHVNVADGTAQSAVLNNIPLGTYYLVMTTYDVDGRESVYSTEVSKTVQ